MQIEKTEKSFTLEDLKKAFFAGAKWGFEENDDRYTLSDRHTSDAFDEMAYYQFKEFSSKGIKNETRK